MIQDVLSIISTRLVTAGFRRYAIIKRTDGTSPHDVSFVWRTIKMRNFHKVKQPAGPGDRVINKADEIWPQAWIRSLIVLYTLYLAGAYFWHSRVGVKFVLTSFILVLVVSLLEYNMTHTALCCFAKKLLMFKDYPDTWRFNEGKKRNT